MADQTIWFSKGISKDILVKIQDNYVPADFKILDMGEEEDVPIILGRPFLNTTNTIIYVRLGQVHFQFPGQKVRCSFNSYTTYEQLKKTRSKRRRQASRHRKNQQPKNEEDDEHVKDEPTPPKSSPQTKQIWKKKVASSLESPSQEVQPSRSPSPGPTDTPKEWTRLEKSPVRRT